MSRLFNRHLNGTFVRKTDREQALYEEIHRLQEKEKILLWELDRDRTLVQRFQENTAMLELIFSLSTEEQIGSAVVNFLHKIYPFATVRLISATNSRTRMRVIAYSEGLVLSGRACAITPLECMP